MTSAKRMQTDAKSQHRGSEDNIGTILCTWTKTNSELYSQMGEVKSGL